MTRVWIGTSGWRYPPWRATFYPTGLPRRRELEYLSRRVSSIEINGSFYSLQRPEYYRAWAAETPDDFVFAVKGARFVTHLKQLRDVRVPVANFLASGVLALGAKLGPVLWQLPPRTRFDRGKVAEFLALLPHTTAAAAVLAAEHDERLDGRAHLETDADRPLRHALEVRHESFRDPAFVELLHQHDVALVVADSAGVWPYFEQTTASFAYVRLHGADELYRSGYTAEALDRWAAKVRGWRDAGRDVFVYFDNDAKVHAPYNAIDAIALVRRMDRSPGGYRPMVQPTASGKTLDQLARRVAELALAAGHTVAVAESLTGGLVATALAAAPRASEWFRGSLVAYSSEVKHEVLHVPEGPVVSAAAASAMSREVRRLLGADVAIGLTGAGGPSSQDGWEPGTVFLAVAGLGEHRVQRIHLEDRADPAAVLADAAEAALELLVSELVRVGP